MIRVVIAEDQAMVRGALAALLKLESDSEDERSSIRIEFDVERGPKGLQAANIRAL